MGATRKPGGEKLGWRFFFERIGRVRDADSRANNWRGWAIVKGYRRVLRVIYLYGPRAEGKYTYSPGGELKPSRAR